MKNQILFALIILSLSECHLIKEKSKETINDAGKAVGQGTSQFFSGIADGVDRTFQSSIVVSDTLKALGLSVGKFYITHQADGFYMVYIYFIFGKELDHNITVKVFDKNGVEYGRRVRNIYGHAGDAHYEEVGFEKRTVIESKSKFTIDY